MNVAAQMAVALYVAENYETRLRGVQAFVPRQMRHSYSYLQIPNQGSQQAPGLGGNHFLLAN